MYSKKGIARPQSQFPHPCVSERIFIFPGSVHIFSCNRKGSPIDLKIYKSLTYCINEYVNVEIGTAAAKFLSRNTCLEVSVLCLCSAPFLHLVSILNISRFLSSYSPLFIRPSSCFHSQILSSSSLLSSSIHLS